MKRLVLAAVCVASLTACVSSRSFEMRDGVCYRTRTEKAFFAIPVSSQEVQAIPENCGVEP